MRKDPMDRIDPLISIIVPIYNVERFLRQCLESISDQTLTDIEVICIDDGSTDGSPAIVDEIASCDQRFNIVHKQNGGYGIGINTGLARAHGTYIGIVESDDFIDPDMFRILYEAAQKHCFPDIVKAAYWRVCNPDTPDEKRVPAFYYHHVQHVDTPFTLDQEAEFLFHHPSIWTAIYKRSFLDEFGIRMKEVPGAGWVDNPFLIETLVQARSIVYVDRPLYYYREFNAGSSSNVKDPSVIIDRWLDMDDIIKRLHISSQRILEGHYNRGCAYIEMLNQDFDVTKSPIKEGLGKMMERIDRNAVLRSNRISRNYKKAYLSHIPIIERLKLQISAFLSSHKAG